MSETISGVNSSSYTYVYQGTSYKPFASATVQQTAPVAYQSVDVHLGTVAPQNPYPFYKGNASLDLGAIADPTGLGFWNAATDTFTETVQSSDPAAATAIIDRLTYTPPVLGAGAGDSVLIDLGINDSDAVSSGNGSVIYVGSPLYTTAEDVTTPAITGTAANQQVAAGSTIVPFGSVAIADNGFMFGLGASNAANVSIEITDNGQATDADGFLSGQGLIKTGIGTYSLGTTSTGALTSELSRLVFQTDPKAIGTSTTDVFTISASDPNTGLGATNNATSVVAAGQTPAPAVAAATPPTPPENVAPITPSTVGQPVFRFYDGSTNDHFYTANPAEVASLRASNPDYSYEGVAFNAVDPTTDPNAVTLYRFYEPGNDTHFYTDNISEIQHIVATNPNLLFEGPAFSVDATMQPGDQTVYRYYNPTTDTHFYTASAPEMSLVAATNPNLHLEGPAFFVKA